MAEVKKRRIVVASILKPVNDTRMAGKIGSSLAATRQFEVHIIGFPADASMPGLTLHALPFFKRLSLKRLLAPWQILKRSLALKPDLFIITTHELLITAWLCKIFAGSKVIYDVQENYGRNILYTNAFPLLLRPWITLYVRLTEALSPLFCDHFFLAEEAYARELAFVRKKYTVLENKAGRPGATRFRKPPLTNLLFSGTLAETTGVFTAIAIAERLYALDTSITLTLAGYCAQGSTLSGIREAIKPHPYIRLVGGDRLIPHSEIMGHIAAADVGIIAYPPNRATEGSIPTKLYEYLGSLLPILLIDHPSWVARCEPFNAAYVFKYPDFDTKNMLQALKSGNFYTAVPHDVFWDSEQPRLIRVVLHLLN